MAKRNNSVRALKTNPQRSKREREMAKVLALYAAGTGALVSQDEAESERDQ